MTGRISANGGQERDHIEAAQATLAGLLIVVDEVGLRCQQAMRRSPLVDDVLLPAVDRLAEMHASLRLAQREIGAAWTEGQSRRWKE